MDVAFYQVQRQPPLTPGINQQPADSIYYGAVLGGRKVEIWHHSTEYYYGSKEQSEALAASIQNQLCSNEGKYTCEYGPRHKDAPGWHPHSTWKIEEFLAWVDAKGCMFSDFAGFYQCEGFTFFRGNLNEYSAAFCFRIFDQGLLLELSARYSLRGLSWSAREGYPERPKCVAATVHPKPI